MKFSSFQHEKDEIHCTTEKQVYLWTHTKLSSWVFFENNS